MKQNHKPKGTKIDRETVTFYQIDVINDILFYKFYKCAIRFQCFHLFRFLKNPGCMLINAQGQFLNTKFPLINYNNTFLRFLKKETKLLRDTQFYAESPLEIAVFHY